MGCLPFKLTRKQPSSTELRDWFGSKRSTDFSVEEHRIAGDIGANANGTFVQASQGFPFPPIPRRNILPLASCIEHMS